MGALAISFATISCTAMNKLINHNDTPGVSDASAPSGSYSDDAAPLLQELARMAAKLRPGLPESGTAGGMTNSELANPEDSTVAIVRLVPGIDLGQWQEWAASGHCEGWIALDIPIPVRSELRHWLAQRGVAGLPAQTALAMPAAQQTLNTLHASDTLMHSDSELHAVPGPGYLLDRLRHEADKARNRRGPMSLALFELTAPEHFEHADSVHTDAYGKALATLTETLWRNCRHDDISGSLQSGILGLIMPGLGSFAALALAERIVNDTCRLLGLPHDGSHAAFGSDGFVHHDGSCPSLCSLRAGVSEIPGEGGAEQEAAAVLEQAREALQLAAPGSGAAVRERVRLYRKNTAPAERETLVLASEKQFLFFGGMQ